MGISDFALTDKVAIVTGARQGMGKSIALTFAEVGANVAICDIVVEDGQLASVAEEIQKIGRSSLALQVDTTRKTDIENMVQEVTDKFGRIDILVNCAAILGRVPVAIYECTEEDWDRIMDTNLKSYFLCCQVVSKWMIKQKKGSIVNISGEAGLKPLLNINAYPTAKAGVIMLTKQLAIELAKYNIRVNDICPWIVVTSMTEKRRSKHSDEENISLIPLGRLGEVGDISNAALFLASDASSWITGHTLVVDGGHILIHGPENLVTL